MAAFEALKTCVGNGYARLLFWQMVWQYRNVARILEQIAEGKRPICDPDERTFDNLMGLYSRQKGETLLAPATLLVLVFNFDPLRVSSEVVTCLKQHLRRGSFAWRAFRCIMLTYYDGLSCSSVCSEHKKQEFSRIGDEIRGVG